ncbi:MAG TPA: AbrB/MazE/SpoVT family DNA-binding domain-containing protein [Firmicutes bacterium]|nr:AbrB/MazE/SpoVT family DNA-binding domain-containing protein [Bacillota bacterium]
MSENGLRVVTSVLPGGTIALPEEVRRRLGLQPFDDLTFTVENGVIVAAKVKEMCGQYGAND